MKKKENRSLIMNLENVEIVNIDAKNAYTKPIKAT